MSNSVDNRVVRMEFDNEQFERNAKTSMGTVEKLKKSLDMDGAAKSLNNLQAAGNRFNLTAVADSADGVSVHFSAMQVAAITALQNIVNKAVDAGVQLAKSLTIDPVSQGFSEYELKMGSIQTIMASTGADLDTVTGYLEELNTYADKTIYSFSDMTSSIGKFTNAGVDLDTAVAAIKGISNEAAVSGANANEASRAMYNFAQALSAGYVKLIDWKSIENANMATVEFKQQLIDTAVACGTLTKTTDGMYTTGKTVISATKNFNDSLSDAWMTTEVLTTTLAKYADEESVIGKKAYAAAQDVKTFTQLIDTLKEAVGSGWSQSFEIIIGNFNEAKELFTGVSNAIGGVIESISTARNDFLKDIFSTKTVDFEQWMGIIKSTHGGTLGDTLIDSIKSVAKAHGIAIDDMIAEEGDFVSTLKNRWLTSDILKEALEANTSETTTSTEAAKKVLEEYKSLATQIIRGNYGNGNARKKALAEAGKDYATAQGIVNKMLKGTEITIDDLDESLIESANLSEDEKNALKDLAKQAEETGTPLSEIIAQLEKPSGRELVIDAVSVSFKSFMKLLNTIKSSFTSVFTVSAEPVYNFIEAVDKLVNKFAMTDEAAEKLGDGFTGVFNILSLLIDSFKEVAEAIADGLIYWFEQITSIDDINTWLLNLISTIGKTLTAFSKYVKENKLVAKAIESVKNKLKEGVSYLKEWFETLDETKGVTKLVKKFTAAWKELINKVKTTLQTTGIKGIFEIVQTGFDNAVEALKKFIEKVNEIPAVNKIFTTLQTAIQKFGREVKTTFTEKIEPIFEDFVENLSSMDEINFENIKLAIKNLGQDISSTFDTSNTSISDTVTWFERIRTCFKDVSSAIEKYSGGAGGALEGLLGLVDTSSNGLGINSIATVTSLGTSLGSLALMTQVVLAVRNLSGVIKGFDTKALSDTFRSIGYAFDQVKIKLRSQALLNLAIAIGVLAASIWVLSKIPAEDLIRTCDAFGELLGIIGIAAIAIGAFAANGASFQGVGLALIGFAGACLVLVYALEKYKNFKWDEFLSGMGKLALAGLALAAFTAIVAGISPLADAVGLTILGFAGALWILADAIQRINNLKTDRFMTNVEVIGLAIGALIGAVLAMKLAGGSGGLGALGSGLGILLIVAALWLFINSLEDIANMDFNGIINGLGNLLGVFALFDILLLSTRLVGQNAAGAGMALIGIGLMITFMTQSVQTLGSMKPTVLSKGVGALTQIMVDIGALFIATGAIGKSFSDSWQALVGLTLLVAVMAGSVLLLAQLTSTELSAAINAIGLMTIMIDSMIACTKLMVGVDWKSILAVALIIVAIAGSLFVLTKYSDIESVQAAASAIFNVLIGIMALMAVIKFTGTGASITSNLATIGTAIIALAGITASLYILAKSGSASELLAAATALTYGSLAISVIMAMVAVIAAMHIEPIVVAKALGDMAIVIAAVLAICWLIAAIPDSVFESVLNGATRLGEIIQAIIGCLADIKIDTDHSAGDSLNSFADSVLPALDKFKGFDASIIASITEVLAALALFTGAEFVTAIADLFGEPIRNGWISEDLSGLGDALRAFSDSTKGITAYTVKSKAEALLALADALAELPSEGFSIVGVIFGQSGDMEKFGEGIRRLGTSLTVFYNRTKGLDADACTQIKNVADAAIAMMDMADSMPKDNGVWQWLTGHNADLEDFGTEMVTFAGSLVDIGDTAKDIDPDVIKTFASLGTSLSDFANAVPSTDGILQKLGGEKDVRAFGDSLERFAICMYNFCLWMSLTQISENWESFFAITARLTELDTSLGKEYNLQTFGAQVEAFGLSMKNFSESIAGIADAEGTSAGISLIEQVVQAAQGFAQESTEAVATEIQNGLPDVETSVTNLGTTVATGMDENAKTVTGSVQTLVDDCLAILDESVEKAKQKGIDFTNGFANGTGDSTAWANLKQKVTNLGVSSVSWLGESINSNSPSKETFKYGEYFTQGFANGIQSLYGKAVSSSKNVANGALSGLNSAVSQISDYMENSDVNSPVITPVVDLTNVSSSGRYISSALSGNYAISAAAGYNSNAYAAASQTDYVSKMVTDLSSKYDKLASALSRKNETPVNVSVSLEGDARGLFKSVGTTNSRMYKATNFNTFTSKG